MHADFPISADDALIAAQYLPLFCHDVLVIELPFAWTGNTRVRRIVVPAWYPVP